MKETILEQERIEAEETVLSEDDFLFEIAQEPQAEEGQTAAAAAGKCFCYCYCVKAN